MSPEERQLLQGLFDRMRSNSSAPRDGEAEQMIADNVKSQPYAPYLLAQTVIVQDQALQAANDRLQHLEQQLHEQQGQGGGGFLSGLFGGGAPRQAPPPPPPSRPTWNQGGTGYPQGGASYPPQQGYAPPPPPQGGMSGGPWGGQQAQPQGGGFLRGALGTAAGVAGGVLAADAIGSLFRSGHAGGGLGITQGVPGFGGGSTVTNNYFGDSSNQAADAAQDKDYNFADNNNSNQQANWSQDANQDADSAQDMADYDVGGDDDGFA